jgi:hypothetical protein
MRKIQICTVLLLLALSLNAAYSQTPPDYVWIEGESPASVVPSDVKPDIKTGPPEVLSDGKWLSFNLDAAASVQKIPESGVEFHYAFTAPMAADYNVWIHIGFEQTRTSCSWQIDNGDWTEIPRDAPTVDVQEIGVWAPVAWLNLGKQTLSAGSHNIAIRVERAKDKQGKPQTLLFGLDAFCLTAGSFHPDGVIRPGDASWMSDADKSAAARAFSAPTSVGAARTDVSLRGQWQYAGDDQATFDDRLGPTKAIPDANSLTWHAINIPGDRNHEIRNDRYVHRYYLRTRINIPAELAGHSFILHVPDESMIATLFVNAQQCGWTKAPGASWDCDITQAIKPGEINEIQLAIKDSFYGLSNCANNHLTYTPYEFWHFNLTNFLDMPVLGHYFTGLVRGEPKLIIGGQVYTSDVFAKPSVKSKSLGLEITLHNSADQPLQVTLNNEMQPLAGGPAEKTFAPVTVTVPAKGESTQNLSEAWANARLWWPDDPLQYVAITRLSLAGNPIDEIKTKFGFREWSWDGPEFKLNGVPWHGFADNATTDIATLKKHGQTMVRVWGVDENTDNYLNECDAQGMCVRRTGIFDGEGADGLYGITNDALWDNYRQQMIPWIKSERNHPSIFIWSIENEITFINGHVTGLDKVTTAQIRKSYDLFRQIDPTRPEMTDGGNALLDESMPVYGGHYMEPPYNQLPEETYDKAGYAHRQVWPITQAKPMLFGEAAYLSGNTPADMAVVGGEEAAIGPAEARPARGLILRMLSEGYRWEGINFHFWTGSETDFYNGWQPTALLCRQWGWTFNSGQTVHRMLGIFNDTRSRSPIILTAVLNIGGKDVDTQSSVHNVAPGESEKFVTDLKLPVAAGREEATWTLRLIRNGAPVFTEVKNISVLPALTSMPPLSARIPSGSVAVFDSTENVAGYLRSAGVPLHTIANLDQIPSSAKVLVIGNDALDEQTSTSSQLYAWAVSGKALIVLEQSHPLKFQALPGEMETDQNHGCMAFAEDLTSPVFDGLEQKDLSCWGNDNWTYRDAYVKPTSGGKSLVQCDNQLHDSALVQMQAGKGIMLLSQLLIGQKLSESAAAQRLLLNMICFAVDYKQTFRETSVVADSNPQLLVALDATGLQYEKPADVLGALAKPQSIAVIDASASNLAKLASNSDEVAAYTRAGGWILFNRLTPDGILDFDKLVGVDHLIRPFRAEKVTWPLQRNPLTVGLPAANVVLGTGKKIMWFASPEFPDPNAYSYVVDLDDIAPFCTSSYYAWNNAVNGFTQKDGAWQLIQNLPPSQAVMPITLPRPEKILQLRWCSDNNYEGCTKIEVEINGKTYPFDTVPNGDEQTFAIPDQPTASQLTVRIADWEHNPAHQQNGQELVGIDNIWIKVARPADFADRVKPMLSIGAMVEYPQGKGGIILCNVNCRDSEENPENVTKKRTVIATLLRNLEARFAGGATIVAGENLRFAPIDISKHANQFRGEQGWFGDRRHTFESLPPGRQTMAGVTYNIYHFTTSIVPEAIMLGASGVPGDLPDSVNGIPVNQKADALFFLQTAHLTQRRSGDDRRNGKRYEMADYIIHYSDGTTAKVPVYAEINVDDYYQKSPVALPGAQIGWKQSYGSNDGYAVAYSMQWTNPHPELQIASVDLIYGPDRRGVPALLAITAASSK